MRPSRRAIAPVNAPRSCPKSSDSTIVSGSAARFTAMMGPSRPLIAAMCRASSSLPVPLSPRMSTFAVEGAACAAISIVCRSAGDEPTMFLFRLVVRSAATSRRSVRFSATNRCRSAALRTDLTICTRLSGFSTKSYAPSRIAWTAVSMVP